MYPSGRFP
jgi:hypothetical protein